jgi:hypothetical protein
MVSRHQLSAQATGHSHPQGSFLAALDEHKAVLDIYEAAGDG